METKRTTLPCSTLNLIPQTGKMGLDQLLVKAEPEAGESSYTVGSNNIFLNDDGQLSNALLVEAVNQLIAAVHGFDGAAHGKPAQKGLFVGVQDAEFLRSVHANDRLTIRGHVTEQVGQVGFVRGVVARDGEVVADLVTKLYEIAEPSDFDQLMKGTGESGPVSGVRSNGANPPDWVNSPLRRKFFGHLRDFRAEDGLIAFTFACPDDFDAFDGHFPGNPILPGITLLEIAETTLGLREKRPVTLRSIKKMKIAGVIVPGAEVTGQIRTEDSDGPAVAFSASFKAGDGREIARFNGTYL